MFLFSFHICSLFFLFTLNYALTFRRGKEGKRKRCFILFLFSFSFVIFIQFYLYYLISCWLEKFHLVVILRLLLKIHFIIFPKFNIILKPFLHELAKFHFHWILLQVTEHLLTRTYPTLICREYLLRIHLFKIICWQIVLQKFGKTFHPIINRSHLLKKK